MGKMFAVVLVIIALLSAYPIVTHKYVPPVDISTHGHAIDEQLNDTMAEAGLAFLGAQFLLAFFIWKFTGLKRDAKVSSIPAGAKIMVAAAFILVGTEVLALGVFGQKAWANVYFTPPAADALEVQVQAEQFAFYFRYPGPDGKFGALHPDKIDDGSGNYFGLDPANDVAARDDVVVGSLVVPVNHPILLTLHSKDVGHSLYVPVLRIQQDFVPGVEIPVHFTATQTGKFESVCTQLCGLGHYNMKAYLQVMSEPDYEQWLKSQESQ